MPASRDRLSRPIDISGLLPNAQRRVNLMVDEPGLHWRGLASQSGSKASASSFRLRVRSIQANRTRLRHQSYFRSLPVDQENRTPMTVRRRGLRRRNVLPSWYPRTPLIARAIERRRAELQDQRVEAPLGKGYATPSHIQVENEINQSTYVPTMASKNIDTVTDAKMTDSDFITPQKKLMSSIDKVRQIWLEENRRLERTPTAKRADRERKVRTLMSLR
ncbi:hypothetical protein vseg_008181 [Gypsophila vaccaria]